MLQRILELDDEVLRRYDLSSLRVMPVCGLGAAQRRSRGAGWTASGTNLYNLYGSTEVAWATIATPEDLRAAPGTAGRPPRGTVVRILDDDGRAVPAGRRPAGSSSATRCSSRATRAAAARTVIDGLMSTGDVGHFDAEGRLFIDGRDDDMIISGGENVFPAEVEDLLAGHDGDRGGRGLRRRGRGVRPAPGAVVVPAGRAPSSTPTTCRQYVKAQPRRATRSRATSTSSTSCPRTATGKVLKRELRPR